MNKIDSEMEASMFKFLEKKANDLGNELENEKGIQVKLNVELN